MDTIRLKDKNFRISIPSERIQQGVAEVAKKISDDLDGKKPLFLCVLNGAFMFAGDLMKAIDIDCEITFVKIASYSGTLSTGEVKTLIGLDKNVKDRVIVIVEDIVDTGLTIESLTEQLQTLGPKEIRVATLLFKPGAYQKKIKIDYVALEVPNDFLIGYGLDYDGLGRNLLHIYTVVG